MKKQHINKIGLICIRNKKLLVVYKPSIDLYITPGGKIEPNETDHKCITREINEELGCNVKNLTYYGTFNGISNDNINLNLKCYFGELKGKIALNNEISAFIWIDSKNKNYPIAPLLKNQIIPKLIARGLIK